MKYLIYLLFPFLFFSCSVKYTTTSRQYYRPIDKGVFSYNKKSYYLANSMIDTTKIYCYAYPIDKPEYFDCYRFFANGRLLKYSFFGKIDTTVFSDINAGGVGYYHIKDNVIRTQEFIVFPHFKKGGGGTLINYYGTIQNDNIKMDPESKLTKRYYFKPKFGRRTCYLNYKKTSIAAPILTPNW